MKTKIFFSALILFVTSSVFYAQSDYERMQNFKNQYKQIEDAIKNVSSFGECKNIEDEIEKFKNDFADSKKFLDKALYPDNFKTAISKIENGLEVRKKDFSQITDLTTQVETLRIQVSELNEKNADLIKQIDELNAKTAKNEVEISRLNKLISQLTYSIKQRDLLVRDLVDSLLVAFIKSPSNMNQAEKQMLISKVKKSNLFYNVERTISDNIQFVKVTFMTPQDFSDMKKQYRDFNKVWKQIGQKLGGVYLNKKEKKSEILSIDFLFDDWDRQMDKEMWSRINILFNEKKLILPPFNNGDQFTGSINSFIVDEIKNTGSKSKEESENTFKAFSDSVYFKTIQPEWIPILIANNMMTKANQESIEANITTWKKEAVSSSPIIIYVVLGIIIIIGAITFMLMKEKKSVVKIA